MKKTVNLPDESKQHTGSLKMALCGRSIEKNASNKAIALPVEHLKKLQFELDMWMKMSFSPWCK